MTCLTPLRSRGEGRNWRAGACPRDSLHLQIVPGCPKASDPIPTPSHKCPPQLTQPGLCSLTSPHLSPGSPAFMQTSYSQLPKQHLLSCSLQAFVLCPSDLIAFSPGQLLLLLQDNSDVIFSNKTSEVSSPTSQAGLGPPLSSSSVPRTCR